MYERELESRGLPVASQAVRNLYRRQEAQDFICLARALADNRDTLALGALLRGPIVGVTERDLLDVTEQLRKFDEHAVLSMMTDLAAVKHPLLLDVMKILQGLFRKRRSTTPHALLSEAIERLHVLPSVAARGPDQRDRAFANLNLMLGRARTYDVRGLKQLAVDLVTEWNTGVSFDEAGSDHTIDSIDVITVHKAKGLEWPIVIPINLAKLPEPMGEFFFNPDDQSVHWTFGKIASSTLAAAMHADDKQNEDERKRLLYVACTRALDQLPCRRPRGHATIAGSSSSTSGTVGSRTFVPSSPHRGLRRRSRPLWRRQLQNLRRVMPGSKQQRGRSAGGGPVSTISTETCLMLSLLMQWPLKTTFPQVQL